MLEARLHGALVAYAVISSNLENRCLAKESNSCAEAASSPVLRKTRREAINAARKLQSPDKSRMHENPRTEGPQRFETEEHKLRFDKRTSYSTRV